MSFSFKIFLLQCFSLRKDFFLKILFNICTSMSLQKHQKNGNVVNGLQGLWVIPHIWPVKAVFFPNSSLFQKLSAGIVCHIPSFLICKAWEVLRLTWYLVWLCEGDWFSLCRITIYRVIRLKHFNKSICL